MHRKLIFRQSLYLYVHKSNFTDIMLLRLVAKRPLNSFCVIGNLYAYSDSIQRIISYNKESDA